MSFLKSMLCPPIRSANHETPDSDGGQKRAAVPAIQLPARFVVGNINRDASRVGKASSVIAKKTMRKRESNVRSRIFLATAHAAHATSCGRWHRALQVMAGERRATSGQRRATTASCGRRQFIFFIAKRSDSAIG